MTVHAAVSPLRIANEAFMVASTIERCPKSMMLRELVMNGLEAAFGASDTPRLVRITAVPVGGVAKLGIWNTGRGLSAAELLQVSDLSSSLFKRVSLDGNFGMGAKAASLTSNRHGLRYRSCRKGRVSEVVLGERGGIYGRLRRTAPDGSGTEVLDVTQEVRAAGAHPLDHDWTEVVLLGNAAEQDTTRDPYDGDPAVPADWVTQTLAKRFFRLPAGVDLRIETGPGVPAGAAFAPALRATSFDRMEEVTLADGVVIHYGHRSDLSDRPRPPIAAAGLGAVVYDGEVYALLDGRRWLLEAPTYGFTFAAKQCSVVVELPHGYPVRPEQYRQFLRFADGDQRQVTLADFGDLVRDNIPVWLKHIIDAMLPDAEDYLAEIRSDLQLLLADLGVEDWQWEKDPLFGRPERTTPEDVTRPEELAAAAPAQMPRPREPKLPTPPEIIIMEDDAQIAEKALAGRAGRYYPARRQLFVNARYEAFARVAAELAAEFAAAADAETVRNLSKQVAEWALVRRLSRTLVHTLGKSRSGWNEDEVKTVQSPEALSLAIDDVEAELAAARGRLARLLGQEGVEAEPRRPSRMTAVQRHAADLAEAEAHLQRAMTADQPNLGRHHARIANILVRQLKFDEARQWIERGIAADPAGPWCHGELANLLALEFDLDGAAQAADTAIAKANGDTLPFLRRRIDIAQRRGETDLALTLLARAAEEAPDSPWPHFDRAGFHIERGEMDEAARAMAAAVALEPASAPLLRRLADVERRRGDLAAAKGTLGRAIALNRADAPSWVALAHLLSEDGDHAGALAVVASALEDGAADHGQLLRARSEIDQRHGRTADAIAAAIGACAADPANGQLHIHKAQLLLMTGDLVGADGAVDAAARLLPAGAPVVLRLRAKVASRRGDGETALRLLREVKERTPASPGAWIDLASELFARGELDEADAAVETALALNPAMPAFYFHLRSEIARRGRRMADAQRWIAEGLARHPDDPNLMMGGSLNFLLDGRLDEAMGHLSGAIEVVRKPTVVMLRRGFEIERRRGRTDTAREWIERAIAEHPADPQPWTDLSNLLAATGDLSGAQRAAERALELGSPMQ